MKFVFFGSSDISIQCLDVLEAKGFLPTLVVTQPDKPKGRGLKTIKSEVRNWAEKRNIEVLQPQKLDSDFCCQLSTVNCPLAVLVSYGKIIPQEIINLFPKGILNMHPSLLPKLRGPSPIETTILNDMKDETGVSIMILDEGMDTGPILAHKKVEFDSWPQKKSIMYEVLGIKGGELLAEIFSDYMEEKISAIPQDNSKATYSQKIKKENALINLSDDPYKNILKIRAYEGWPVAYFLDNHNGKEIKVKITDAEFENGELIIKKVIPEGKKEMDYESFKRGLKLRDTSL